MLPPSTQSPRFHAVTPEHTVSTFNLLDLASATDQIESLACDMQINMRMTSSPQIKTPRRWLLKDLTKVTPPKCSPMAISPAPTAQKHWAAPQKRLPTVKNLSKRAGISRKINNPPALQKSVSCVDLKPSRPIKQRKMEHSPLINMVDQDGVSFPLPHYTAADTFKRITCETMFRVLDGSLTMSQKLKVIDCRYPYEYAAGHIKDAVNVCNTQDLEQVLFSSAKEDQNTLIVLHCEFSIQRAPKMARFLRSHDRHLNSANYPALYYPNICIMDGGFRDFFALFHHVCEPSSPRYVEMKDKDFEYECRSYLIKESSKPQKLRRWQSEGNVFGQGKRSDIAAFGVKRFCIEQ